MQYALWLNTQHSPVRHIRICIFKPFKKKINSDFNPTSTAEYIISSNEYLMVPVGDGRGLIR